MLKEITKEQSENLKEALTFILNEEFKDILVPCDNGYLIHKELREQLKTTWLQNKEFDVLISKGIDLMKKIKSS